MRPCGHVGSDAHNRQATLSQNAERFTAGAKTLPQRYFVSPEVFAEEQKKIFSKHSLLIGHQSQIAKAGDYFVAEVGDESLIIARDQRSTIRGFYNVCRHRGTRLKEGTCGHASAIQCPYHAWTYGLDGRLIRAPHMDEVQGFDKADYSLHPVNLGLFEGFIFVNLADDPMPLEEWFAPLAGKFSHWNMSTLRSAKRIDYDVRANWKLIFENYSECYHCPGVHPALSKLTPYDSAENDLCEGPFLGGFMSINKGKSLTMSGNACALGVNGIADPGRAHDRDRVFYYSIFPNMLLRHASRLRHGASTLAAVAETHVYYVRLFFHPKAFERPDFQPEDAIEFWT